MQQPERHALDQPILIIGSGRSGTTIISEIVIQHEDLGWQSQYNEVLRFTPLVSLWRYIFDNRLWRIPRFWKYVGFSKNTRQGWGSFLTQLFIFNPVELYGMWEKITGPRIDFSRGFLLDTKASPEEKAHIRNYLHKMVRYQGRKRLFMKFTGPARLEYLTSIFPDAKIINIVRDPIPTVRSWLEVGFWQRMGINKLWWTGAYSDEEIKKAETLKESPALITAFQYKKLMETTAYEIKKLNLQVLELRYEDFVSDPQTFIQKLLHFTGLPESTHVQRYIDNMSIQNRNNAESKKTVFSEELKKQILDIINN
jgi:hypothetical protein